MIDYFLKKLYNLIDAMSSYFLTEIKEVSDMKEFTIVLNSINDVKNFVNVVTKYDYEIDLISGRYVVDAKSIMGIFSLDLTQPIKVEVHKDDCADLEAELKEFIK